MKKYIVAGIGTDVGKTVVAAILTTLLEGEYWKPVQTGTPADTCCIKAWSTCPVHPPAYTFETPVSPHQAAKMSGRPIDISKLQPPATKHPLIIEPSGGVLAPLTNKTLVIDIFKEWKAEWILVSKHYLGSINHTLLTTEALSSRNIPLKGIIFNGYPQPDSEEVILQQTGLELLERLHPEKTITSSIIKEYAYKWRRTLQHRL